MTGVHIERIQIVANGLGELINDFVFVGGAVAELYTPEAVSDDIRISEDIDCVIEIDTTTEYTNLEKRLQNKGFQHDTSSLHQSTWHQNLKHTITEEAKTYGKVVILKILFLFWTILPRLRLFSSPHLIP